MEKREIKFRAWNKKDSNLKDRMIQQATITNNGLVVMPDGDEWDIPLMQYTGLKDKNGKEIYEGDIVMGMHGDTAVIGQVRYTEESIYPTYGWDIMIQYPQKSIEVIGNIYENPELLKTAKG